MEDQQNYFLVCQVRRVRTKYCLTLPITNKYEPKPRPKLHNNDPTGNQKVYTKGHFHTFLRARCNKIEKNCKKSKNQSILLNLEKNLIAEICGRDIAKISFNGLLFYINFELGLPGTSCLNLKLNDQIFKDLKRKLLSKFYLVYLCGTKTKLKDVFK